MSRLVQAGRWVAVATLALAYALLAHYTNTTDHAPTLGTVVALAPVVLITFSLAWQSRNRLLAFIPFIIGCMALFMTWDMLTRHFSWIYWGEHAGTQLTLCIVFGRTLDAGREPLCTCFARMVHGSLTPALERYTRQVTVAWTMFFGLIAATSTIIFFTAPLAIWSVFSNFFTAPLIGAMFIGEYLIRRRLHPNMEHAHILDAIKAYWNAPAG